jgi:hypothetical protein
MLIHNYGLFWRKNDIFWGCGPIGGHLKGTRAGAKREDAVDFKEQQGVYCLYDENFRLVYVGQAGSGESQRLGKRLGQHRTDSLSERWSRFSWFGIRKVIGKGKLKAEKDNATTTVGGVLDPGLFNAERHLW